jgi:hypothetical protein
MVHAINHGTLIQTNNVILLICTIKSTCNNVENFMKGAFYVITSLFSLISKLYVTVNPKNVSCILCVLDIDSIGLFDYFGHC